MTSYRQAMQDYLELRRSLGFKLSEAGRMLEKFVSFLEETNTQTLTTLVALSWAKEDPTAPRGRWTARLSVVRQFAHYFRGLDPSTEVPPHGILTGWYARTTPHIYSDSETTALIGAARGLLCFHRAKPGGLRPATVSTFIGLLAVTGLRSGEAINLKREDVDFGKSILTVRDTKFGKTRLVPLHDSTLEALREYTIVRDQVHSLPKSPFFFVGQSGARLSADAMYFAFIRLSRQVGLRGVSDKRGPRLHDFRHTFAVNTVTAWYEAGLDVGRQMPLLSTFLGHAHVADTYWYLSANPRLLSLAADRLARQ